MAWFSETKLLNIKYVFWFSPQLSSETFLILRGIKWDIITNLHMCSCKVPIILARFEWNLNNHYSFWKILSYLISWKSVQWKPSCSMGTDRQTYMTKPIIVFCTFAYVPRKGFQYLLNSRMGGSHGLSRHDQKKKTDHLTVQPVCGHSIHLLQIVL